MTMHSCFSRLVESREIMNHAKQQLMQHIIHLTSPLVTCGLRLSFNIPPPTKTTDKTLSKNDTTK
jgi:hypothetical protein